MSNQTSLRFQVKVYFQPMREMEQNLERSKSADDVVADHFHNRDDFKYQSRSHTADRLCQPPQKSPKSPARPQASVQNHHRIADKYDLLSPGVQRYGSSSKRAGMSDTGSIGESMEGISIGGSSISDNEHMEDVDDLSDTETDNEWEGCEVTQV